MKNVEDIYTLSPLQQGMLFHTLYAPESGVYVVQQDCLLQGELNAEAFRETWRQVIARHAILRTAFVWEGLREPHQVVRRGVELPWVEHDWRGLDEAERERLWRELRETERRTGFDLTRAPLLRLVLARTGEDRYRFLWTFHHILLDGWSGPLILGEVFTLYRALDAGRSPQLPKPRPYRDYIDWLHRQDLAEAERFWRRTLQGFTAPTPLALAPPEFPAEQGVVGGAEEYEARCRACFQLRFEP